MTLCILDIESSRKKLIKVAVVYLIISLLCAVLGAVYECFSHEVWSFFMVYAFLFPLAGGALPSVVMLAAGCHRLPSWSAANLYHSGIATLTVGSFFKGALEIYGTTNRLTNVYWIAGVGFTGAGILYYLIGLVTQRRQEKE